jgi:hypothetical protein
MFFIMLVFKKLKNNIYAFIFILIFIKKNNNNQIDFYILKLIA